MNSPYFLQNAFDCKCGCGFNLMDPFTVVGIHKAADIGKKANRVSEISVNVRSGCRCSQHNTNEGGGDKSQHLPQVPNGYATAADVEIIGITLQQAYFAALAWEPFYLGGIGLYLPSVPDENGDTVGGPIRLHLDARGTPARWGYIGGVKVDSIDLVLASAKERGL